MHGKQEVNTVLHSTTAPPFHSNNNQKGAAYSLYVPLITYSNN